MRSIFTWALASLAIGYAASLRPGGIAHYRLHQEKLIHDKRITQTSAGIKAYDIPVPIDHFHNDSRYEPHSAGYFNLRYWLDTSNYRQGGPVIVMHSGEFDSEGRLPYLEHGVVPVLTKAFGGIGLVLEHRYYGTSFPTENTTAKDLRFLSIEQAVADTAYFAQTVTFPGLEHVNLTAGEAPWIIYGGSYAATVAALTRKIYPDVYWGAISSSGVPESIDDYWQYLEAARHFAPEGCSKATQTLTHVVDNILFGSNEHEVERLKELFHLQGLQNDEFGETIALGIMALQYTVWDVEEDSPTLGLYCASVTSHAMLFASMRHRVDAVRHFVTIAGYSDQVNTLSIQLLNWAGFIRFRVKELMSGPCSGLTKRECFSPRFASQDTTSRHWLRSWSYQTCIEHGFFITGSGVPKDKLPLISRAVTRDYASWHCPNLFNITKLPNLNAVNKYGGFNFGHHRVAHIDGAQDPWRAAGVHAMGHPRRNSTMSEPYILIDWGVHHWDQFGLRNGVEEEGLPPTQVTDALKQMVHFVGEWLKDWTAERGSVGGLSDENSNRLGEEL